MVDVVVLICAAGGVLAGLIRHYLTLRFLAAILQSRRCEGPAGRRPCTAPACPSRTLTSTKVRNRSSTQRSRRHRADRRPP